MDMEPKLEVKEIGVKVMENEVENNNDDVSMIRDMVESGYAQVEIDLTMRKVCNLVVPFYISLLFIS